MRAEGGWSGRRLARALEEPVSRVGRWGREVPALDVPPSPRRQREGPEEAVLRERIRALCAGPRHLTFGYRRITALLRRQGQGVNRQRVSRCMREMGLTRPRVWHRPQRPRRVERMRPERPNQAWQVDMTSFQLASLPGLFLVVIIDCFTRQIVGWTLERRCRASDMGGGGADGLGGTRAGRTVLGRLAGLTQRQRSAALREALRRVPGEDGHPGTIHRLRRSP